MMLNADVRKGEGVGQMRTPADRGRWVGKWVIFADVFYGRPLKGLLLFPSKGLRFLTSVSFEATIGLGHYNNGAPEVIGESMAEGRGCIHYDGHLNRLRTRKCLVIQRWCNHR